MLRHHAGLSLPRVLDDAYETITTAQDLKARGWSEQSIRGQVQARRWQRIGRAVVLHNGPLPQAERERAMLVNAGPRAVLTAFTAAQMLGLSGWERETIHVLVPAGARGHKPTRHQTRVHYCGDWEGIERLAGRPLHRMAPALALAASTFAQPRPAVGILAAGVQQRLVTPRQLADAVEASPRVRHRHVLLAAIHDIAQGSHALSEIDFVRLCRRFKLPPPDQQVVRLDPAGRRRYLDATWRLPGGRMLSVEIDGALHLAPRRWYDDQLRQNELALTGVMVLRFPSVVVRTDAALVAGQLRRALGR